MNLWQAYLFVGLFVVAVDSHYLKKNKKKRITSFFAIVVAAFLVMLIWPFTVIGAIEAANKWCEEHDAGY